MNTYGFVEPAKSGRTVIFSSCLWGEAARTDLCALIRAALYRRLRELPTHPAGLQQIQLDDATVTAFYDHFHDNLADLFDAIAAWQPDKPVTDALANEAVKTRWLRDPDFRHGLRPGDPGTPPGWSYERALAAVIVVAAWWQFELPTPRGVLASLFKVSFDVTSDLESHGILRQRVSDPILNYCLDHELRARRYMSVAASDPMFTAHLAQIFSDHGLDLPSDAGGLTDFILMLGILGTRGQIEQAEFFRQQILDRLMFRGYTSELLRITATLRNHFDKLQPPVRVRVLADGGGVRRRINSLDEAWNWLAEAERLAHEHDVRGALGSILYERAYVRYLSYDFDEASRIFEQSALHSPSFWRYVSEAKAAEARFQNAIRNDLFSRNLDPTRVLDAMLTGTLEQIWETLEAKRTMLVGFSDDGAKRWAVRLLLHLADVCLEVGDDRKTQELLDASAPTVRTQYPAFEPVLEYLYGRLALTKQRPEDALGHLERSLKGYEVGIREPEGLGDLLIALGDTQRQLKEADMARAYYIRAQHVDDERKNGHARAVAAAVARLEELVGNSR